MKIQVLAVTVSSKQGKSGKTYQNAEVAYKNFDSGKVESKNLTEYSKAFKPVVETSPGQCLDVFTEKNENGFWEWTSVKRVVLTDEQKADPVNAPIAPGTKQNVASAPARSTYETPEERAKKQVYIVKQSSLSLSKDLLSVGAKTPPKKEDVVDLAQYFTDWVFSQQKEDVFALPNDLPGEDVPF